MYSLRFGGSKDSILLFYEALVVSAYAPDRAVQVRALAGLSSGLTGHLVRMQID